MPSQTREFPTLESGSPVFSVCLMLALCCSVCIAGGMQPLQAKPGVRLHMLCETVDGHDLDVLQVSLRLEVSLGLLTVGPGWASILTSL